MATVFYPKFAVYRIDAGGARIVVASATITRYNVTAASAFSSTSSGTDGYVAGASVTATVGDVIRFGHATYPEYLYYTLTATAAEAYMHPNNVEAAYVAENLATNLTTGKRVELYAQDLDNLDITPWKIGEGLSGTTVEIPYQTLVEKNLRIFPQTIDSQFERMRTSFQITTNAEDITIPSVETMALADDSWESVRRNYGDTGFETYDTRASRPLFDHFQTRTTTSTSLQTLHLFNINRTLFTVNGDTIIGEYTGKLAANANDKYIYLKFAGTTLFDSNNIDPALGNNKKWRMYATLTRVNTSTLRYGVDFHVFGRDPFCSEGEITGLDFPDLGGISAGLAYDLTIDGSGDAAGDVTLTLAGARFVNAPPAPLVTNSLWAYYESSTYNGAGVALPADGASLSAAWQDLSGNARHATVTGTPTFETNELNGLPVVRVGADSNDYFTIPDMSALTSGTIFIVQKVTDVSTDAGHKLGADTINNTHYPYTPDTPDGIYDAFGSSDRKTCGASQVTITAWHVTHVQSIVNNWNMWQNGMLLHNDTSHTVEFGTAPKIGFNGTAYMKADIAAVYIYSNNMSTLNAAKMYRYIAQKWGV